jgi:hypothetical protein
MKKNRIYILLAISFLLTALGCQKVINIDLNSTSPTIVIIGSINDQPGPYTVNLSQTVNFSDPNTFPPVNGAFVTIADNAGNIDTLAETTQGNYNTKRIMGVAGRTYTLTVTANGQTYTSSSTMPQAVTFDTMEIVKMANSFRTKDTSTYPVAGFLDPSAVANYYRFIVTRNDTVITRTYILDDEYSNGLYLNYPLRYDTSLVSGDSVKVEMQCIDKGTYQYLSTLSIASGSTYVTPANPATNISNNGLGYFSAHTSRYRRAKVF